MFIGLGLILMLVGAVLAFAVRESVEAVDLEMVGWILIAGGALSLLIGAIQALGWWSSRRTRSVHERVVSDDGRHVVDETRMD